MRFVCDPRWDASYREAVELQRQWAPRVSCVDRLDAVDLVAGVDLAFGRFAATGRVALVVWRPRDSTVVERHVLEGPVTTPYIPGLLSWREGPLIEQALARLEHVPDVLLVDGQGIAHPRRFGIACHLGVMLDRPVVGVAKSRLCGSGPDPGPMAGDRSDLVSAEGERLGVILRTRPGGNPLYVSPGHAVSIEGAANLVVDCLRGHRLPEPTFLADRLSKGRE